MIILLLRIFLRIIIFIDIKEINGNRKNAENVENVENTENA